MAEVAVISKDGKVLEKLEFSDEKVRSGINESLVAQVVRCHLASRRRGTASTKSRSEVKASGRKPYRQKGTGRARAGSAASPLWRGGGVAFGPKPRNFSISVPAKMRRGALKACIADRVLAGLVAVVDGLEITEPRTREMRKLLDGLDAGRKPLLVIKGKKQDMRRSIRNIPGADIADFGSLNAYEVLSHEKLFFDRDLAEALGKMLGE